MSTPSPLEEHLAYLESIGSKPCTCRHEWKKSRDYMPGWVRMNTEAGCQEHGTGEPDSAREAVDAQTLHDSPGADLGDVCPDCGMRHKFADDEL